MLVNMMSKPPGCSSKNSVTLYTCSSQSRDVGSDPITLLQLRRYAICCTCEAHYKEEKVLYLSMHNDPAIFLCVVLLDFSQRIHLPRRWGNIFHSHSTSMQGTCADVALP